MTQKSDLLYDLILLARPIHQQVEAAIAAMLSETTVTVRMRAVLEQLENLETATVPQVAKQLGIQRQYVQVMMNEVEAAGLVKKQVNPAHKRSVLFELSSAGKNVITQIRKAEMAVVESISQELTFDSVNKAHQVAEHVLEGFRNLNESLKA
ncbi:MarR family winged helix-turn-helix transcriptional regulator [Pseudohalocynthiibacter aestuariivivens]|jgi:DNA-binding MarR family transcriptional regulator|uniref:MarR family winged helix-turn-helix transcriptional regulator n=1 Tax=Pseudohalocynthiibacter aestuariivivens TaxID=1591409 RepID=A0ABV5JHW0_9RHOB|nr:MULTISPECIES: MarR family winged helix-turn-helix transcriptional regulator [Pseudohalocynthiibacter]MBS9717343.1 winged helix-turn-helix transcriptional regulator [Pseudohalocynthiibacter aestuariivivens]MCK0102323.1 MarR family winged helix-turn-helix transcriptional regulator [Pseudohalocynthiibacter sp. F2068]